MFDLFDTPPVAGLALCPDFLSDNDQRLLLQRIAGLDLSPFRFQGWEGKRLTLSFGWRYDFDDRGFDQAAPMPDWLLPFRDRAAPLAKLDPESLVHALVIRYDPGAGIGWHRDRPHYDRVFGLSLGTPVDLRLRRRRAEGGFDRASVRLDPGSAYLLDGEVRRDWEHSIAPVETLRFSITFRSLSDKGRALASG